MVLSDHERDGVVSHLQQIVAVDQLSHHLKKAGIYIDSGLWSQENVQEIMSTIETAMIESLEILPELGERGFNKVQVVANSFPRIYGNLKSEHTGT